MSFQQTSVARPPLTDFLADRSWKLAVVAHRGAWYGAPENSISSVELAIRNGFEFVEIDVQSTADGELVCIHDDTAERMTGQPDVVAQTTAADLAGHLLREGAGGEDAAFTSEHLALLGDLLDVTSNRIYVDIDVKHLRDLEAVCDFVRAHPSRHHVNLKTVVETADDLEFLDDLEKRTGLLVKPIFHVADDTLGTFLGFLQTRQTPLVEILCDSWTTFELYAKAAKTSGTDLFLNTLDEVPSAVVTDNPFPDRSGSGMGPPHATRRPSSANRPSQGSEGLRQQPGGPDPGGLGHQPQALHNLTVDTIRAALCVCTRQ